MDFFLSLVNLMEERLEDMKQLEMPDHSMNKKWRLIRSHKWTTKKKSSMGAWILDVFHASHRFCLWQAILTNITGFGSILRLLWIHYYEKISFGNLTAEGWQMRKNWGRGALCYSTRRFSWCPDGTQTRDVPLHGNTVLHPNSLLC